MMKRMLAVAVTFTVFALAIACTAQKREERPSAEASAQWIDRSVDVGGHKLHLRTRGEGGPVVVIEPGISETYRTWTGVADTLARETRVLAYDRAGYGESEPGPLPRTPSRETDELAALLAAEKIPTPVIILGHSLGASNSIIFAARHPDLVAGLVLIDPAPIDFLAGRRFADLARMASEGTRAFAQQAETFRGRGDAKQAAFFEALASEHASLFSTGAAEVASVRSLGAVPIVVIGSTTANPAFGDSAAAFQAFWLQSNERLATLSTKGRFVRAEGATHHVHVDRPDIVIAAVRDVIAAARMPAGSKR